MKKRMFHFSLATAVAMVTAISLWCVHQVSAKDGASNNGAAEGKYRAAIARFLAGPIQRVELEMKEEDVEAVRKEPRR